jgi:outer membrane protein OmpA-like peptidoglycan-associated protein
VEWDGTVSGRPVPDGKYMASVSAGYAVNGDSESNKVEVLIDSTPPDVSITAAPDVMVGDKKSLLIPVEFKMAATDTSTVRKWQLVVWDSSKKPFFNISGAGEPPEKYSWDGRGSSGSYAKTGEEYYFGLYAWDGTGNMGAAKILARFLFVKEIKIIFSSDALFDPGMSDVKTSAYRMVSRMKSVLEQYPGVSITVAGHTDDLQPSKKAVYSDNGVLSKARADAVKYYMVNMLGIDADTISTEGDADNYPIAPNDSQENRAKNRRVEIIIRPDVYK